MEEVVTDWLGRPIGVKKKVGNKVVVTDWIGNPKGEASDKGTVDFLGRKLSDQSVPDIFLKE